jgi:HrpA-like RNA helicase
MPLCIIMVVTARQRLIEEVRSSRAVIIVGETGSGKTTRMLTPTLLHSLWWLRMT